jgi:hypothetical protein
VTGDEARHPRREKGTVKSYQVGAKLGTYDGNTCLETFLAKFDNCSQYFEWDKRDQLFHLKASLGGAAGQTLWTAGKQDTVADVIKLLRNRFGSTNQAERFRAELRARKRRPGEGLQSIYQDVCRLMSLAYPGQANELSDIVARDSFLEALDNHALRVRILDKDPKTLEDALSIACRLEAFEKADVDQLEKSHAEKGRNKSVRFAAISNPSSDTEGARAETEKQLRELKSIGLM